MKKVALVFVLAVIAPSLVLAWLALRTARDQQLVLERQQTMLAEEAAEAVVRNVAEELTGLRREFTNAAGLLLTLAAPSPPDRLFGEATAGAAPEGFAELRYRFDEQIRAAWPPAAVGFAVNFAGECFSPSMFSRQEARQFRLANEKFLCNRESVEVVWNGPKGRIRLADLDNAAPGKSTAVFTSNSSAPAANPPETGQSFRDLIGDEREGAVARFVDGQLSLLLWYRPVQNPFVVFGAQLQPDALRRRLAQGVRLDPALAADFAAVLLDDDRQPVTRSSPGFSSGNRRPLAAAEVGEVLPHWRVAVFALDPARVGAAATTTRLTVGLLVALLMLAIGVGSWLIVADLRRQLAVARQKTDFVGNVSHELKTPLTSIRMFAELLAEDRVAEPEKRKQFLGIIGAESARLTRLINQVLDFARLERGEQAWQFTELELRDVVCEAVETCRPQLEAAGIVLGCELPAGPAPVSGDRDALAQVVVNLLSNVEKYAAAGREATVRLVPERSEFHVEVLDRGPGVPAGCGDRIFEQFFRGHDSLASGIQGSGLGLTLARQIVRAHGGDLTHSPREGGGSRFVVRLPRAGPDSPAKA